MRNLLPILMLAGAVYAQITPPVSTNEATSLPNYATGPYEISVSVLGGTSLDDMSVVGADAYHIIVDELPDQYFYGVSMVISEEDIQNTASNAVAHLVSLMGDDHKIYTYTNNACVRRDGFPACFYSQSVWDGLEHLDTGYLTRNVHVVGQDRLLWQEHYRCDEMAWVRWYEDETMRQGRAYNYVRSPSEDLILSDAHISVPDGLIADLITDADWRLIPDYTYVVVLEPDGRLDVHLATFSQYALTVHQSGAYMDYWSHHGFGVSGSGVYMYYNRKWRLIGKMSGTLSASKVTEEVIEEMESSTWVDLLRELYPELYD